MPQLCRFAAREPGRNEADGKMLAEAAAIRYILGGSGPLCIAPHARDFSRLCDCTAEARLGRSSI